jgi:O-antigen ligase
MPKPFVARVDDWGRVASILIGFAIPISTALDGTLSALVLLCWLGGRAYREKRDCIRRNPVALAALALLLLALVAVAWSGAPLGERLASLRKYGNLLLIPVFAAYFAQARARERGLIAFAAGLALTLVLSFAVALDWIPAGGPIHGTSTHPVFKSRIAQNILMSFGALLFLVLARRARSRRLRVLWAILTAGAVVDVLGPVEGRTGYVVLPALCVMVSFTLLRWKGIAAGATVAAVLMAAAYQLSAPFHSRVDAGISEATHWNPHAPATKSIEYRLEFYANTLRIVSDHPLTGVGTGGFKRAYAAQVQGTGMLSTSNPHNMYLIVAAELGVLGVLLLVYLLAVEWHSAGRLSSPDYVLLARGVVLTVAISGLFNSILIDHTECLFFAWMSGLLFAELGISRAQSGRQ